MSSPAFGRAGDHGEVGKRERQRRETHLRAHRRWRTMGTARIWPAAASASATRDSGDSAGEGATRTGGGRAAACCAALRGRGSAHWVLGTTNRRGEGRWRRHLMDGGVHRRLAMEGR
jgi:hypothetical protein